MALTPDVPCQFAWHCSSAGGRGGVRLHEALRPDTRSATRGTASSSTPAQGQTVCVHAPCNPFFSWMCGQARRAYAATLAGLLIRSWLTRAKRARAQEEAAHRALDLSLERLARHLLPLLFLLLRQLSLNALTRFFSLLLELFPPLLERFPHLLGGGTAARAGPGLAVAGLARTGTTGRNLHEPPRAGPAHAGVQLGHQDRLDAHLLLGRQLQLPGDFLLAEGVGPLELQVDLRQAAPLPLGQHGRHLRLVGAGQVAVALVALLLGELTEIPEHPAALLLQ